KTPTVTRAATAIAAAIIAKPMNPRQPHDAPGLLAHVRLYQHFVLKCDYLPASPQRRSRIDACMFDPLALLRPHRAPDRPPGARHLDIAAGHLGLDFFDRQVLDPCLRFLDPLTDGFLGLPRGRAPSVPYRRTAGKFRQRARSGEAADVLARAIGQGVGRALEP